MVASSIGTSGYPAAGCPAFVLVRGYKGQGDGEGEDDGDGDSDSDGRSSWADHQHLKHGRDSRSEDNGHLESTRAKHHLGQRTWTAKARGTTLL